MITEQRNVGVLPPSSDGSPVTAPGGLVVTYHSPRIQKQWIVVAIEGEIDSSNAGQLELATDLSPSKYRRIALDLRAVPLCDPEGILTLLKIKFRAERADQTLRVVNLSPPVHRLLHESGVDELLARRPLYLPRPRLPEQFHQPPIEVGGTAQRGGWPWH